MRATKEEMKDTGKSGKTHLLLTLLLFLAVLAVAFLVYLKSRDIDISGAGLKEAASFVGFEGAASSQGKALVKTSEVLFEDDRNSAFTLYGDMLARCTADGLRLLDKSGSVIKSVNIPFVAPKLETNGGDLLAVDIGGKYLCVVNGTDIKWDKKTDGTIINASISENGYVTVIQKANGYRNRVRVFDPLGVEKFFRNIAEDRVITAAASPSGEELALLAINTSGVNAQPSLQFFDMIGAPLAAKVPKQDQIFAAMAYLSDDSLVTASDTEIICYDSGRQEKWRKEFDKIISFAVSQRNTIIAYRNSSNKLSIENAATQVEIYNFRGQKMAGLSLNDEVRGMRSYSGLTAVYTAREVYFVSLNGKITGKYSSSSDINDVYFFSKAEMAIVTRNSVELVKTLK